jgi:hypothetical protein
MLAALEWVNRVSWSVGVGHEDSGPDSGFEIPLLCNIHTLFSYDVIPTRPYSGHAIEGIVGRSRGPLLLLSCGWTAPLACLSWCHEEI